MKIFDNKRPLALVCWPQIRAEKIQEAMDRPGAHEWADGFTALPRAGFGFAAMDPTREPWNPLLKKGSTLAGLDPLRVVRQLWNASRFDVLVSMDTSSCAGFLWVKRLLGWKKPVLVVDPAMDLSSQVRRKVHDYVIPRLDGVFVFGRVQLEHLRKAYPRQKNVWFVPHRMDTEFFDCRLAETEMQPEPYVLTVGDDAGRDFATLLAAMEQLNAGRRHARLLVRTNRRVEKKLPDFVTLCTERLSFEKLRNLYHNAAAVVVPLHRTVHASGINTLLEAMSMSKAVVVSDSPGVCDYVEHDKSAWVTPAGDSAAMANAIETLLGDKEQRERLGRRAREFCENECAFEVYAARVAQRMREVIEWPESAKNAANGANPVGLQGEITQAPGSSEGPAKEPR